MYRYLIEKANELNYKINSRRDIIDTLKRLNKYRSTNTINTALVTVSYKNISKKRKMKTLKIPDAFVQSNVREVLESLEKRVDAVIKKECSLCGPVITPPLSSTTRGANLPMNFSSAKRWIPLPSGRTRGRRLIVEQTGRYEGPRFIPHSAGRHLHWVSNNTTLLSKTCCLLDYLLKEKSVAKDFKQSMFVENISLKLAAQNVKDKEIVRDIDQQEIQVAVLV